MMDLSFASNKPCALYEVLHWQDCHKSGAYVKIHNDCRQYYNITFYCQLAAKRFIKTVTNTDTDTYSPLYDKTPQQVMVGWTFRLTLTVTLVLMKLNSSPQLRVGLYNEKSDVIRLVDKPQ